MLKYYGKGCSDIQVTNASNRHKKIINKKPMEGKCLHPKPKKMEGGAKGEAPLVSVKFAHKATTSLSKLNKSCPCAA